MTGLWRSSASCGNMLALSGVGIGNPGGFMPLNMHPHAGA